VILRDLRGSNPLPGASTSTYGSLTITPQGGIINVHHYSKRLERAKRSLAGYEDSELLLKFISHLETWTYQQACKRRPRLCSSLEWPLIHHHVLWA